MPASKKPAVKTKAKTISPSISLATLKKHMIEFTDEFCAEHLNKEYRDVCRVMVKDFCVEESPARTGDIRTWAASIVATVGFVNLLDDPTSDLFITQKDLAKKLGVPQKTLNKYCKVLIDGFDLIQFDPDFTLPSMIPMNPFFAMASSPTLLTDCCQEGNCCEGGACSMEGCDREDCCQLEVKPRKTKKVAKKK